MFAYDLVRTVEPLGEPNPDPLGRARPGADADRRAGRVRPPQAHGHGARQRLRRRRPGASYRAGRGDDRRGPLAAGRPGPAPGAAAGARPRARPRSPRTCRASSFEAIVAGSSSTSTPATPSRSFPSQRWSAPVPVEAFSIYRGLRAVNPSPYMYFLDFGDFEIAGASPEPLITVTGRQVSTRPIAGTRPRGATAEEDRRMADELLADEKERAEHVMLVDLGRNDLGRVCEYGTRRGRELHGGRELQPRDAHRLQRRRDAAARSRRARRAALGASRRARCPARPRSARCRSSTSWSRSSAAATAARSAGSATPASSTPASTSARWWSRTASPTSRPAAGPSPTPSPTTSSASPRPRPGGAAGDRARGAQPEWP